MFFRDHGVVYQVEKIYLCHVNLRESSMKELRGMCNNTNFDDTEYNRRTNRFFRVVLS